MSGSDKRELWPAAIEAAQRLDPDCLDELAHNAADRGDLEEAIEYLLAAMAAGGAWAGFNLGLVLTRLHQHAAAAVAFRAAADAGVMDARVNLGSLLSDYLGQPVEAERECRLAASAGDTEALFNLALLHIELGRRDEAVQELSEASGKGFAMASLRLADLLADDGAESEAEAMYARAIEQGNEGAQVETNAGMLLAELGRQSEAETLLAQAVAADVQIAKDLLEEMQGRHRIPAGEDSGSEETTNDPPIDT